jgi:hypothetical protein
VLLVLLVASSLAASADTFGPVTLNFSGLTTGADSYQPVYSTFSFPKFDMTLGSLQALDLAWSFSGTMVGSATGVSESPILDATLTHSVFFDFEDPLDSVFIAEPELDLTTTLPAGTANATFLFGPQFQLTTFSFSVGSGDPRFEAWGNGPGTVTGRLGVSFGNFTQTVLGPQTYHGTDSGVYDGWLSVAYEYTLVPEPNSLALTAVTLSLFVSSRRRNAKLV